MKNIKLFFFVSILFSLNACEMILDEADIEEVVGNRIAYYWIMADADTYVECVKAGGACVPVEANYAGRPLVTSHNALGIKRSYIDFPIPNFPAGTRIEEAYVELFHSGTNEDGKTDNISIDITRVRTPWVADEVHYENQPVQTGVGGEFQIKLRSNDWSGSNNMAFAMNQEIENPANFHGFVAFISRPEPGYEKGHYSNNDNSVIQDGLGRAPRLLLKVELPEGVSVNDIGFPERHTDANGSQIFGSRVRQTVNWPADWDIAALKP